MQATKISHNLISCLFNYTLGQPKNIAIKPIEGPFIESEAELKYEWSLNKDETIKKLEQKIEVEDRFKIKAKYNHQKDETRIKIKYKEDEKKIEYTLPGLVIIKLTTKSGNLDFEF